MTTILKNKKKLEKFCQDNDITYLGLFGSYARGEAKNDSDVDLLYKFRNGKSITLFGLADLKIGLEKIFKKKVDFVSKNGVKKELEPYINKDLVTIYGERP
jgi:uncharacterized protein